MLRWFAFLLACLVFATSNSNVLAANKTWTSAVSGDFTEAAKWSGGVPGAGDTATFSAVGTYTITFDNVPIALANPVLNEDLFLQAGTVTFTSGAGGPYTYRLTGAGGDDAVITGGSLTLGTSGNPLHLTVDDDLRIRGNASLLARFGSDINTVDLVLGDSTAPAGDGTLTVDGSGSSLTVSGLAQIGAGGETGTLTLRNSAAATFSGSLTVADSSTTNTTGVLDIESGADLTAGNISLATTGGAGTLATLNLNGAGSTVTQTGASTLTVGHATHGTANLNIGTTTGIGTFNTGTGLLTINATGKITVGGDTLNGTLNANGDVTVDGGVLEKGRIGQFNLADGKTINITGGGRATFAGAYTTADATYNITGANSRLENTTAAISINHGADVNVTGGGTISSAMGIHIGTDGSGRLVVDGSGSSVTATSGSIWGSAASASITFRNNASGSFANLNLGGADPASAFLQIESGGDVVASDAFVGTHGLIQIVDAGSTMTLNPGSTLNVGSGDVGVHDGGSLIVGAGGTTNLNPEGEILVNGGTADLQTLVDNGGRIRLVAGSLSYLGMLRVATGGVFDNGLIPDVTLPTNRQLSVTMVIVDPGRTLTLDGGTLNADRLDIGGTFIFNSGTLGISFNELVVVQPTGTLHTGASIIGSIHGFGTTSAINVTASGVALGSVASLSGFQHEGTLNVGAHTVTLNSGGYARLGALTTLSGGTINAPSGVAFATGSNFLGNGTINARIVGELGSVIEANGPLSLGNATQVAAFNFDGELRVNTRTVTLNSTSPAGLGNVTHMGVALSPGTLNATNGFVLDFDEAIVGYGTVNSTNTLAKRSIVNGTVFGNSVALPITFTGYVKGVGTFDNVVFAGTFDPGLSPTLMTVGNIAFLSTNSLVMELGGTARGSQYDAILASGALGLDGALQVALIDSFSPAAGNSFDLFDWASVSGTFDTLQLPTLAGGLTWDTSQLYTTGVLSVAAASLAGDYNHDGRVDAADYVVWRKNDGSQAGYDTWRTNFGRTAGSGAASSTTTAVPEPAAVLLCICGTILAVVRRNCLT